MVLFDQGTYDKLLSEAPKYKLITPSILSDRLRVMFEILFLAVFMLLCLAFDTLQCCCVYHALAWYLAHNFVITCI